MARRRASATGHGDLTASLVLVFPLYLAYAVGILFTDRINGVDFVSHHVWDLCRGDRVAYLVLHASVAIAFWMWLRHSRRDRTLSFDVVAPVLIEAAIYALTLGTAILFVMHGPLSIGPTGDRVVASIGAGVHEELVFRLLLCGGGTWALVRARLEPRLAAALAIAGSSILFSLAHFWRGEAYSTDAFVYRVLAGLAFALIFRYRSLAHAVYAHALYDVWVLVLHP